MSKYHSRRTEYNGTTYDSAAEARLAMSIDAMFKAGELQAITRQVSYPLFGKNGSKICVHRVDFVLWFKDGHKEIWEQKGYATRDWKLKYALMRDNYPELPYVVVTGRRAGRRAQ